MLGDKNIRFIQEFSSPVHGNVYVGKTATVGSNNAKKFIEAGLAEEIKAKQATVKKGDNVGTSNTSGSKTAPKGNK
jgi:hypothetical protein